MVQLHTRSRKYRLDTVYFNESIVKWVDIVHTEVSKVYGMKKIKIKPADYGHDSYVYILCAVLPHISTTDIMASIKGNHDISKFVEMAHLAWIDNYLFWKSIRNDDLGEDHTKTINTYERNDRATTHVKNLNEVDLELYTDVITVVFEILTKKIMEAGMQNLQIG